MRHIKSIFIGVTFIMASIALYYSKTSSELVYVDVNKLIEGYERTKDVKKEFEKKVDKVKSNLDSLETQWQNELKSYEKERLVMSQNELKLKKELMSNKQQQINNYQDIARKKIQEEDSEITQTVINDINDYVKEFGKKNRYKIIFGASGGGNIMYGSDGSDITNVILNGLNSEYVKK